MPSARTLLPLTAFCLLAGTGCRTIEGHARLGLWADPMEGAAERMGVDAIPAAGLPRIALAEVRHQPKTVGQGYPVPAIQLTNAARALLAGCGRYEAVIPVERPEDAANARYLVELTALRARTEFMTYHDSAIANNAVWAFSSLASYFARDQRYGMTVQLHARVTDLSDGRVLLDRTLPQGVAQAELNWLERGRGPWRFLWGVVVPPACFPADPDSLARRLGAAAMAGPLGELTREITVLGGAPASTPKPEAPPTPATAATIPEPPTPGR